MKTYRRLRKDYPKGVISIFDNGGKTFDRYTVLYTPWEYERGLVFPYVDMSAYPFHPQGFGQHGELTQRYHKRWDEKTINFVDLPEDCQKLILQDLKN